MTTETSTPVAPSADPSIEAVLSHFGLTTDTARAEHVAFGCFGCGSIASVTVVEGTTYREQVDAIDWDCCGDTFSL